MMRAHHNVLFLLASTILSVRGVSVDAYVAGSSAHYAQVGDAAIKFTCVVSGASVVGYRWLKNGEAVLASDRIVGVGTSSLFIYRLSTADSGEYGCQATLNTGGVKGSQTKAQLTVFGLPEITFYPDVSYRESLAARLTCRGKNYDGVFWFRNNERIDDNPRYAITDLIGEALIVENVTLSDAGSYTCVAVSTSGAKAEKSLTLTVETEPKVELHPANVTVQVGFRAQLTCNISGIPTPGKTWFRGRTKATVDTKNIRYVIRNDRASSTLVIENIKKTDEDYYYCAGTNDHGHVESNKAKVVVGSPPTPPPPGSKPIEIFASKTIAYGQNDSIACRAQGLARPIASWTKDGELVNDPSLFQDETGELFVVNVTYDHAGQYVCTIEVDNRPIVIQTVHVDVKGPPDPPVITAAKAVHGVITVNWTDPLFDGNSPIIGYEIYWRQAARRNSWASTTVDRISAAKIDVRPSLPTSGIYTYDFSVKASNGYGVSRRSDLEDFVFYYDKNSSLPIRNETADATSSPILLEIGTSLLGFVATTGLVSAVAIIHYERRSAKEKEFQRPKVSSAEQDSKPIQQQKIQEKTEKASMKELADPFLSPYKTIKTNRSNEVTLV